MEAVYTLILALRGAIFTVSVILTLLLERSLAAA